jgi:hypothetical protein
MRVVLIHTHVGRGLRPEIIVHQFPPKVRTYLKSTTGNFLVPARTNIAVKLLRLTVFLASEKKSPSMFVPSASQG